MAQRIRGYQHLVTARPQGTAAQLGEGRIDVQDVRPSLLRALDWIGGRLNRTITIFSGYRTDAYSASVGGFAGDPHSRHIAVDAEIDGVPIGQVPGVMPLIRRTGLISGNQPNFYHGQPDPEHVQLGGNANVPVQTTLAQLWIQAGGPPNVANLMAAIAMAESHGNPDVVNPSSGATGLWQIHPGGEQYKDPMTNARTAVSKYRTQGLGAWEAYTNGSYRQYLAHAGSYTVRGGLPPRPGGGAADGSDDGDAQLASWQDYLNPTKGDFWDPGGVFRGTFGAIKDVNDFLKWIAWIFHPRNLLRIVEFLAGMGLLVMGIGFAYKDSQRGGGRQFPRSRRGSFLAGAFAGKAASFTPQGRAVKAASKASRLAQAGEGSARARRAQETHETRIKTEKARATELRTRGGRKPPRPKKKKQRVGFA